MTDPAESHQKAIPMSVLRKLHEAATTASDKALATLAIGAIFFCMHLCEYLKTPKHEEK